MLHTLAHAGHQHIQADTHCCMIAPYIIGAVAGIVLTLAAGAIVHLVRHKKNHLKGKR